MGKRELKKEKTEKIKRPHKRRALPVILVILLTCVIALVVWVMTPPAIVTPPDDDTDPTTPPPIHDPDEGKDDPADVFQGRKENFYTFLLLGTVDDYNTDTIMLGSIDTETDKVNIISIPRDTQVDVEAKIKRINGVYGRDGAEAICKEVARITGVYPDFYGIINMNAFIKLVDMIGGVDYYVPFNMVHEDADPTFNIKLSKGQKTLTGKQALQLVRYRGYTGSDFKRMEVQRDFLLATLKQVMQKFTLAQVTDIISLAIENTKTNMKLNNMVWFYINVIQQMDLGEDIVFHELPTVGTGYYKKQDYVYIEAKSVLELINATINPYTADIPENKLHIIHLED